MQGPQTMDIDCVRLCTGGEECLDSPDACRTGRQVKRLHPLVICRIDSCSGIKQGFHDFFVCWISHGDVKRRIAVLIDNVDAESGGATGRSKADAPEIDGEVHLRDAGHLSPGDIVTARIEDSDEHDLFGVPA